MEDTKVIVVNGRTVYLTPDAMTAMEKDLFPPSYTGVDGRTYLYADENSVFDETLNDQYGFVC